MPQPTYRLTETTPPGAEPLTLDDVKNFLRVDHDKDDAQITGLISAARQVCENATGRSLITRSYSLTLDRWPGADARDGLGWWDGVREGASAAAAATTLTLPKPPLLSVTRINIYAADNTFVEFPATNYYVDVSGTSGRIVLKESGAAPAPGRVASGIEVQFKAGYGATPQSVPFLLRLGMKQLVGHLYEHRGDNPERALQLSGAAASFMSYRVAGIA